MSLTEIPEELIVKIIDNLPVKDALWNLSSVSQKLLRLSLTSVKVIHITTKDSSRLESLLRFKLVRNVIKHAILSKHSQPIGRKKLLEEMKRTSKDGNSNILAFFDEPTDKELSLLAQYCRQIESLYLIDCDKVSDKAFIAV